ncbi:Cysteine peptidase [Phytophthora cactorum]|nr:Cysteine peptidase [Phytophthora cactorum]
MQAQDRSTSVSVLRSIGVAAIAAAAVSGVDGRQMHAGINYHRYLAERAETRQELADWKASFGEMAKNNGWMPPSSSNSEERSADDDEEDHLQRFYMTKQNISAIQALNPNANFSTNTPFTLLTNDEFAAYVGRPTASTTGRPCPLTAGSEAGTKDLVRNPRPSLHPQDPLLRCQISALDPVSRRSGNNGATASTSAAWARTTSSLRLSNPQVLLEFGKHQRPLTPMPTTAAPTPTPSQTTATPSTTAPTKSSASPSTVTATDTSTASTSNEVDWTDSNCMSPIQSQGSCGDCWAFSTAAAIESGQCINGGQKTLNKYSEQQLTSCDSQNYGCSGGAPIYAMEYVQKNGLCTEDGYPFTSSDGTAASCTTGCSAVDTGITGYETVDDASGLATRVAQQPVIVAVASGNKRGNSIRAATRTASGRSATRGAIPGARKVTFDLSERVTARAPVECTAICRTPAFKTGSVGAQDVYFFGGDRAQLQLRVDVAPVSARPMHAGINYQRYLTEIDSIKAETDEWKAIFEKTCKENNWMPEYSSEERSSVDPDEDLRQRIFMSKQDVLEAQAANPNANFSIMTPFSALTKEEFSAKVLNSYVRGNTTRPTPTPSPAPPKRSLRQQDAYTFTSMQDMINSLMQSLQQQMGGSWTIGTVKPATDNTDTSTAKQWHWTIPVTTPAPAPIPKPSTPVRTEKATLSSANSVDWSASKCMSPVQSQGQCGSCWAFASVAAVESLQCIKNGQSGINKYSEQQLVGCDSQNMGCGGGAPVYAYEYIQKNGLCAESAYPYTSSNGGGASCSASCSKSQTGITGYERINEGDEAGLVEALKSQPVVVAVASGNAAWKQYTGGVMSTCETTQVDHAVLVVGYDDNTFKVRNSWGENWGEAGYVRMARSSSGMGTCGMLTDMSRPKIFLQAMHVSTLCFAIVAAVAATPAFARPMHAGIDYQRYLEEIDTTQEDLDEWRSKFGDVAQKNGWMSVSEARSADDQEEDLRQRIFLTKQSIATVQAANPNANFSIMSPFSAMTDEEFNKYVVNSYVRGSSTQSASGTNSRQLRSAGSSDSSVDAGSDSASIIKTLESFIKTFINGLNTATIQPASAALPTFVWFLLGFFRGVGCRVAQCIANGKSSLTKYSEQQLVSCNTQNWGCNGGAPGYALDYVQQNGLCKEGSYPYTSDIGYADSCSRNCDAQDTGLTGYSQVSGEDGLLNALDEHPVIVAVASGNNVWKQYTGGVVSSCDSWQPDHAVVAVGYDSSSIKIRNSWGTYWGEEGYIRLARSASKRERAA